MDSTATFATYADRIMQTYRCPGLALGVARNGEPAAWHAFGFRDREAQLPITPDTVMGIGSCTKSFTCMAIMRLQEERRLSVYEPVIRHLPEFGLPDDDLSPLVTIHHLMTHTAGLPPLPAKLGALAPSAKGDPSLPPVDLSLLPTIDTPEQLLGFIRRYPFQPLARPGWQFSYSDEGYGLLGAIIERVSGRRYEQYVTEELLQPAGMEHTTFSQAEMRSFPEVATLYAALPWSGEVIRSDQWWEGGPVTAAGFLRSTVRDLLRYVDIFRTGGLAGNRRILSAESVREMMQPHVYVDDGFWYGYGLAVRPDYHGLTVVEHGGSLKGVSAHFIYMAEDGLTGAALGNMQYVPAGLTLLGAMNEAAGLPTESRWTRWAPAQADLPLAAYAGAYAADDGVRIEIAVDGDALTLTASGLSSLNARLTPAGGHRFGARVREEDVVVNFLADEERGVWGLLQGLRVLRKA
ncbi:MAG TPA: serine hydrolase domain-containing protein [Symbiobacteriaceae bacterium]|nr:serine hydrolase domain-containing protein [Symbiobacteriaceae bacterium]